MIKIAVTGGMSCGKTTILNEIQSMGYKIFSFDEVFKLSFEDKIVQDWLNNKIKTIYSAQTWEECQISGKTMTRYLIASHPLLKKEYDDFVYKIVKEKMIISEAVVAEVPLLFELELEKDFHNIWVVACETENQISRLMSKINCNRDYALAWIGNQIPIKDKIAKANRVIFTDCSVESLRTTIVKALQEDLI